MKGDKFLVEVIGMEKSKFGELEQSSNAVRVGQAQQTSAADQDRYIVKDVYLSSDWVVAELTELRKFARQAHVQAKFAEVARICCGQLEFSPELAIVASALLQDLAEETFALGYHLQQSSGKAATSNHSSGNNSFGEDSAYENLIHFAAEIRRDSQTVWMLAQTIVAGTAQGKSLGIEYQKLSEIGRRYRDFVTTFKEFCDL